MIKQGDDACVMFENESGNCEVWFGNVLQIRREMSSTRKIELYKNVDLNVDNKREGAQDLVFTFKWYKEQRDGSYAFDEKCSWYEEVRVEQIICPVKMQDSEKGRGKKNLMLNKEVKDIIDTPLTKHCQGSSIGQAHGQVNRLRKLHKKDRVTVDRKI